LHVPTELDTNLFPPAYLITFRTYGTWLHGERRGSVDRNHNIYGTPQLPQDRYRQDAETRQLKHSPILLNPRQRSVVEVAIREVCQVRRYELFAMNVRTNHVHSVIGAACVPERIVEGIKACATRRLREAGLISATTKPWARHGSTRYLWKDDQVGNAVAYVMYDQGE
jgi:REP element-mobilizing transposase RayT